MKIGETFENEAWRVHRFAPTIRITEIRNAGKRGKKCRDIAIYDLDFQKVSDAEQEMIARAARKLATENADIETMEAWARSTGYKLEIRDRRGVDTRGPMEQIEILGPCISISANRTEFCIKDLSDRYNEPTIIDTTRTGAVKVHNWLKKNKDEAQLMSFREINEVVRGLGVLPHYYCAMD